MSQVIKQIPIETKITGYYLRLTHCDQNGVPLEKEPFRFLRRKPYIHHSPEDQSPEARNVPHGWTNEWEDDLEDAYLFADPDLAFAEVKRLSELSLMVDDDNGDPDDKTKWLVPGEEMTAVLDKDYLYTPIFARFEIVPVVEVKPIHVADYQWKMEKADPAQIEQINKEGN